ncbi:MAG TPA: hypothetical protein VK479_12980 [Micropepsaceae bacterium]|jgi:hypothetical protein|nr:hypothetical protein [Micropepsaceae bacterium]
MPRVSLWFFAVAPIYVLIGMCFGIFMGATENFTLAPAHAHLNLIGWVTMALYGTFYALAGDASKKLAWAAFWLNNAGVAIMFPSLAMVLSFGDGSPFLAPLIVSEFLVLGAMLCFAFSVWGVLMKSVQAPSVGLLRPTAAE